MDKEYGKLRLKDDDSDVLKSKKKPRVVKKNELVNWKLLKESNKENLDELFRIYKDNPYNAGVYFRNGGNITINNNNSSGKINKKRWILSNFSDGSFNITEFITTFGISKTNKMYSRQKKGTSIIFKNNRLWFINNNVIRPLKWISFNSVLGELGSDGGKFLKDYFKDKFFWFKTFNEYDYADALTFNTVILHKLYGHDDMDRYLFKTNKKVISVLRAHINKEEPLNDYVHVSEKHNFIYWWKKNSPIIDNLDNLTPEFFNYPNFEDTFSIAHKLGKRINAKWGKKTFVNMHDTWSFDITRILLSTSELRDLNVRDVFMDFAEFSGYKLLTTNREMLTEGLQNRHCVGTYIDGVDRGDYAIYSINGFTLQLQTYEVDFNSPQKTNRYTNDEYTYYRLTSYGNRNKHNIQQSRNINDVEKYDKSITRIIVNNQFKGYKNSTPPDELVNEVNNKLIEYSNAKRLELFDNKEDLMEKGYESLFNDDNVLLPF